jgi:pimeloyl-ACP methyl ester carboxylesterase
MKRFAALTLVSVVTFSGLVACTGDASENEKKATTKVREVECPDDVEAAVLESHSCSEVDLPDGSSMFVLRVEPPSPSEASPVVVLGTNLGSAPDYGGLAPVAQRTGRVALITDLPGTAHSTPLLDCPEVSALSGPAASDPVGAFRGVVAAVSACKDRLSSAGVHPQDVSVAGAAADLHAMVTALGLEKVIALSAGTTGTVGVAWAQQHPEDLEAMVLDTPLFTAPPLVRRSNAIIEAVARDCAADPACTKKYGDVTASWSSALKSLRSQPLPAASGTLRLQINATLFRRAIFWLSGRGQGGAGLVPSLLADATNGTTAGLLDEFAADLIRTPPYCTGYLPKCQFGELAYGAALAYNCPTMAGDLVWTDICAAWGTPAGDPFTHRVVDVPTLVLLGRYNGFSTTAETKAALGRAVPEAFYLVTPSGAHNVLGEQCMREIRSSWLAGDVTRPPADTDCLDQQRLDFP